MALEIIFLKPFFIESVFRYMKFHFKVVPCLSKTSSMKIQEDLIIPSSYENKSLFFYPMNEQDSDYKQHINGRFSNIEFLEAIRPFMPEHSSILEISDNPGNSVLFFDKVYGARDIYIYHIQSKNLDQLECLIKVNAIDVVKNVITKEALNKTQNSSKKRFFLYRIENKKTIISPDVFYSKTKLDLIHINKGKETISLLDALQNTIEFSRPTIAIAALHQNIDMLTSHMQEIGYVKVLEVQKDNLIFESQEPKYCGGDFFIDQNNNESCFESLPTTIEELAIIKWLDNSTLKIDNQTVLHLGTGNGRMIKRINSALHIDTLTISGAEKINLDNQGLSNVEVHLINKHNIIELRRLKKLYNIIIDVNLKSFTCCNEHFDSYMDYIFSRLDKNGVLITASSGVNFGWNGNTRRAFTPGSKRVDPERNFRILGDKGLDELAAKYHLKIDKFEITDINHHHGQMSTDGPPFIGNETVIVLSRIKA